MIQIYASNFNNVYFIVGKGLAYFLIGIVQALITLLLGSLIWNLRLADSSIPLLIGTVLFLIDSVAFGLLIGVKAENLIEAIPGSCFHWISICIAIIWFYLSLK